MDMNGKQPQVQLTHTVPIVAYQSLSVRVGSDGSFDMLFYQNTSESQELIEGDVVAAVHIPDRQRWDQIRNLVEQQLNIFEQKEP